jgi:glycosyltransferase involved in cell wall biosynthesis
MALMLSVLVPTYNRPGLLAECLASLRHQMAPDEYEVLVLNDGGIPVPDLVAGMGWPFRYHELPHRGLCATLNSGLDRARGTYLTVCADDDTVLPDGLACRVDALDADLSASVVYGLPVYHSTRGALLARPVQLRRFMARYPRLTWADIEAGSGLWVHGTGPMYRTRDVRAIGGWDAGIQTAEEYDLHLRLLKAGGCFVPVDQDVVTYRAGGKSRNPRTRAIRKQALDRIYRRLELDRESYNQRVGRL